jgi:HPr kinase/phosphorylase
MSASLALIIKKLQEKIDILQCDEMPLTGEVVESSEVNVLGLEFSGFTEAFPNKQIQIIDRVGLQFLATLDIQEQDSNIAEVFSYQIPAVIFVETLKPDDRILNLARANNIPVFTTNAKKSDCIKNVGNVLEELLAPKLDHRGTMMEVFGLGVLICGKSNVGKSECAIDLIQRGHRLIGDDIVEITKRGSGVLIAKGKYPIESKMELRGIGVVDIVRMFGVSSIKKMEKVELIIQMERWNIEKSYERLGIDQKYKEILGVPIALVEMPVAPGRNSAIMVEVATMNYRLRERGIIPAKELDNAIISSIAKRRLNLKDDIQ